MVTRPDFSTPPVSAPVRPPQSWREVIGAIAVAYAPVVGQVAGGMLLGMLPACRDCGQPWEYHSCAIDIEPEAPRNA